MTDAEVSEKYQQMAVELADIVAKMNDMRETCQFLTEQTQDEGDPKIYLDDAIRASGVALASIVTYAHEYKGNIEILHEEDEK